MLGHVDGVCIVQQVDVIIHREATCKLFLLYNNGESIWPKTPLVFHRLLQIPLLHDLLDAF